MITEFEYEVFQRTIALVGEENFLKVKNSTVLVVGLGGVGGVCAEAIARSGVSKMILCDYDYVDRTNINRQIIALHSSIGLKKTDVLADRICDVNPNIKLEKLDVKISRECIDILDNYRIDYIVDAIDSFDNKIELIQYAKKSNIPIISAMGAGGKLNPTAFKVADYKDTRYCKLAKKLRKRLKEIGIKDLKVVYSEEEIKYNPQDFDFIPSISYVPPVMGYIIASELIKDLIDGSTNWSLR